MCTQVSNHNDVMCTQVSNHNDVRTKAASVLNEELHSSVSC